MRTGKKLDLKKKILVLAFIMVLLSSVSLVIHSYAGLNDADIVAHIDGEPVTVREYAQALLRKRAEVYAYFKQAHGVDDHPEFWTGDYGGEVPLHKIKAEALEDIVHVKVQQILAKEKGLVQDISYESFLKELTAENARRHDALKKNQVIYGPKQYDETGYFNIVLDNMTAELKKQLQDEMVFTETAFEGFYRENINQFKQDDSVKIQKISVKYPDQAEAKEKAEQVIKAIQTRINKGEAFENLANAYGQNLLPEIKLEEQSFEPQTAKADAMMWRDLLDAAQRLEVGQISEIMDYNGAFYLIKCIERTKGVTIPLDEAKDFIKLELSEKEYKNSLAKKIADAQVVINDKVYQKMDEGYVR